MTSIKTYKDLSGYIGKKYGEDIIFEIDDLNMNASDDIPEGFDTELLHFLGSIGNIIKNGYDISIDSIVYGRIPGVVLNHKPYTDFNVSKTFFPIPASHFHYSESAVLLSISKKMSFYDKMERIIEDMTKEVKFCRIDYREDTDRIYLHGKQEGRSSIDISVGNDYISVECVRSRFDITERIKIDMPTKYYLTGSNTIRGVLKERNFDDILLK